MDHEPSKTFHTSLLQLKLDQTTHFEWQKYNQSEACVALYTDLLEFINLQAQATETLTREVARLFLEGLDPFTRSKDPFMNHGN